MRIIDLFALQVFAKNLERCNFRLLQHYQENNGKHLLSWRFSAFDPNVWSGRALQVDFAELAVSGLASMYPAFDWSVWCSGPSWISARVRSR
jgi:hypothetical protein